MASYRICKTCRAWVWFDDRHTCQPLWIVAPESDPSDMRSIYAGDSEDAAKKWAEAYDSDGEYYLAKGGEMVVLVGRSDAELVRVSVEGETVPSYSARELGPAPTPAKNDPSGGAHDASDLGNSGTQS